MFDNNSVRIRVGQIGDRIDLLGEKPSSPKVPGTYRTDLSCTTWLVSDRNAWGQILLFSLGHVGR